MNKFTTSIAVAAIAIATTGVAEARIALGGDETPTGGEFMLAITNLTKQTSYVLDTGRYVTAPNYANSLAITGSTGSDTGLASFLSNYAAGDNVIWGFGSSYKKFTDEADAPLVGYYGTKETPTPLPAGAQGWDQAGGVWDTIANGNQSGSLTDNATNGSSFKSVGQIGYLGDLGKNGGGNAAYNIFGDLANALVFIDEGIIFDPNTGNTSRDYKVLGSARLNLTANGFSFQYAPTAAPIPLPAAVWMFGAGLMGVLRLNRRKAVAA